jgi:hypothetical protein
MEDEIKNEQIEQNGTAITNNNEGLVQQTSSDLNLNNNIIDDNEWRDIKQGLQGKVDNISDSDKLIEKSVISSNYTISKAPGVSCKIHGKMFIGVDTNRFCLICQQCQQEGKKGNTLEYQANEEDDDDDSNDYKCHQHPDVPGVFYCDDCKCFICKLCFANNHRSHNSNIPSLLGEEFKTRIRGLIEKYNQAKPKIEDAYNGIITIYNNIKKNRDESIKRIKDMANNVANVGKSVNDNLNEKLKTKFNGIDTDIEDTYNRLVIMSKKINKYQSDLDEVSRQAKIYQSNPIGICEYKKSKVTLFNEVKALIKDSKQMLEYKIETLKSQVKDHMETFKKQLAFVNKQTTIFEKSVLTSIKSGVSNNLIVLRRFTKFSSKGLKYYKTSSVWLKVNSGVFLSGLGICGLYLNSTKRKEGDFKSEQEIPLNITISEVKEEGPYVQKLNERHKIHMIVNRYDPTFLVYFKKGLYLKPFTTYQITLTNMDKNNYIDIWCGEASKKFLDTMEQKLDCNCTNVEFTFKPSKDVESDLNEFNSGVIGSLIYSYTKSY